METKLLINFPGETASVANQSALNLQDYLLTVASERSEVIKDSDETMDFGATLAIILGTGSLIEISKGISNWMQKQPNKRINIKTSNGEILGENLSSSDIAAILQHIK